MLTRDRSISGESTQHTQTLMAQLDAYEKQFGNILWGDKDEVNEDIYCCPPFHHLLLKCLIMRSID